MNSKKLMISVNNYYSMHSMYHVYIKKFEGMHACMEQRRIDLSMIFNCNDINLY